MGTRQTLGVIDLSTCTTVTPEFILGSPADVSLIFSRLRLPGGLVTAESLREMVHSPRFTEAGLELADAGVGAIAFACTSASLLLGPGFDRVLSERLSEATRTPATTTATAVVEALAALGAERVAVGTPYVEDINRRERHFLEAAGFAVPRIEGLGLLRDREIGALGEAAVRDLARRVGEAESDVVFLSCTNLPALPLVAELEAELGRPVLTSNSATIWKLLGMVGRVAASEGLGTLLSEAGPRPDGRGD